MKEKIIARLRALYPGVNLTPARLDAIANKLSNTEEADIDAALSDLNSFVSFADIARHDDRDIAALAFKKKKEKEEKEQGQASSEVSTNETPANLQKVIADAIASAVTPLVEEISALKNGKTAESRKLLLDEALKTASPAYKEMVLESFPMMNFESDEKFKGYLDKLGTSIAAENQHISDQTLASSGAPFKVTTPGNNKEASKEEVAELSKNLKI